MISGRTRDYVSSVLKVDELTLQEYEISRVVE